MTTEDPWNLHGGAAHKSGPGFKNWREVEQLWTQILASVNKADQQHATICKGFNHTWHLSLIFRELRSAASPPPSQSYVHVSFGLLLLRITLEMGFFDTWFSLVKLAVYKTSPDGLLFRCRSFVSTMLIFIQAQLISETIGSEFNWQDKKNSLLFFFAG